MARPIRQLTSFVHSIIKGNLASQRVLDACARSPQLALAVSHAKGMKPFPEGEKAIAHDLPSAMFYCRYVLKLLQVGTADVDAAMVLRDWRVKASK